MAYKRILLRRDTAANWTSGNPVLASGELGYETNTGKFKIGNGSTAWNSLSYTVNAAMSGVTLNDVGDVTITAAANGDFLRWNGTAWINDAVNLSTDTVGSYVESLVAGANITLTNNSGEAATPTIAVSGLTSSSVGLGNVNNTSDANKPVSTATQTALDLKANLESPTFTGTVTLPDNTVALGTKTTGNYVASLVAGTGVTLTNNSGETATPTVAIGQAVATNSNVTFNDVTVSGNLTVSGTTTSINTETLTVDDNIIVLNNNAVGAPSQDAGIEIERGSSTNVALRWNETGDVWEITTDGSTYSAIATTADVSSATGAISIDNLTDVTIASASNGQFLKWNGSAWVNDAIDLGTDTAGSYVASLVAGANITLTDNSGEGATPTIAVSGLTSSSVGLGNVDNTSDANKPVSTATQTALDLKANLASPTFTGTVTLPNSTVTTAMLADGAVTVAKLSSVADDDQFVLASQVF
jgi:hypothetical protein